MIRKSVTFGLGFALLGFLLAGCQTEEAAPMTTDGPNQVVLKVPGMS